MVHIDTTFIHHQLQPIVTQNEHSQCRLQIASEVELLHQLVAPWLSLLSAPSKGGIADSNNTCNADDEQQVRAN